MLPPTRKVIVTYLFSACKGEFNMNIPREELILCLITLAQWIFEIAKFCFISGILLTILGLAIFGLVVLLRSRSVKASGKVR